MAWELDEALEYYRRQGAPSDQLMLVNLLKEIQTEEGGISPASVGAAARYYNLKESFLLAIIRRYPSLKLKNCHCLEICCGVNCSKKGKLLDFAEKTYGKGRKNLEIRASGCMRMCGKGPNIRWDGTVFNGADEALIRKLVEENTP